jgi:hypothetical protein
MTPTKSDVDRPKQGRAKSIFGEHGAHAPHRQKGFMPLDALLAANPDTRLRKWRPRRVTFIAETAQSTQSWARSLRSQILI